MLASEREGIALLAKLFQGFADRSRLEILLALDQDGALTVSEIMKRTELGQSNASSHLACLRECGLGRAEGKVLYERAA